jgi:dTDP-4-dehydrorhamnose 3,5-epimerase
VILVQTKLQGAYIIDPERMEDERGFFARTWCRREFQKLGLNANLVQCNVSFNRKRGTWRGMHYQTVPFEEAKLVRCTRGAISDVLVDLRRNSSTYKEHVTVELSAENGRMFYIPEGCAHGFVTLEDYTEVFYQMSEYYSAGSAQGFRWNDPSFGIRLPVDVTVISDRDRNYPDFAF